MTYKHGLTNHPLFWIWRSARQRCTNKNRKDYHLYGGRGIKMCSRWSNAFIEFFKDMAPTYQRGLTLERVNNDGPYNKRNCRWVTYKENLNNKRTTYMVNTPKGRMPLKYAAQVSGINYWTLKSRVENGWPIQKLFEPPLPSRVAGRKAVERRRKSVA